MPKGRGVEKGLYDWSTKGVGVGLGVVFVVLICLSERLLSAHPLLQAAATPVSIQLDRHTHLAKIQVKMQI